jgi:hypothetical protein
MDCEHLDMDGTLVVRYLPDDGTEDGVLEALMASVLETESVEAVYGGGGGEDGRAAQSFYAARAWEALPVREVPREQKQDQARGPPRERERSVRLDQPRWTPAGEGPAGRDRQVRKDKAPVQQPKAALPKEKPVVQRPAAPVPKETPPAPPQQEAVDSVELGEDELLEFAAAEAIFGGKHIPENSHYAAKVEGARLAKDRALQEDSDLAMALALAEAEEGDEEEEEEEEEQQGRRQSTGRRGEDTETTGDERSASESGEERPQDDQPEDVVPGGCLFIGRRRGPTKEPKDGGKKGGWRGALEALKPSCVNPNVAADQKPQNQH